MIKIGIVDDNLALLRNVASNLAIFDELDIIFKAHTGQEALEYVRELIPDVILMDIEILKWMALKPRDGSTIFIRISKSSC